MTCNFKYINGDLELVSPSWEGLIQLILSDHTGVTPADYLVDSLNFYNTDADVISEVISDLTSKDPSRPRKEGLTGIIKEYLKLKKSDPEEEANVSKSAFPEILAAALDYVNYCKEFGIQYHACVDALKKHGNNSAEYRKALDDLWNIVEKYRIHSKEWDKAPLIGAKSALSFMTSLTSKEVLSDTVFNSLDSVTNELKKHGLDNLVTELRIDDPDVRHGITGVLDAVTWDSEGNVTIWDFKTTPNSEVSETTKLYRLAQLRGYKEMLIKHSERLAKEGKLPKKLSADKIKIRTLQITQTVINGGLPDLRVTTIDPDTAFKQLSGQLLLKVTDIIYTIYPREGRSISSVEANAKKERIVRLVNPIMSELGITKLTAESQKAYLAKFIDLEKQGKPVILRQLQESQWKQGVSITKWKKEGDLVIGYDASGKQVIKDTLDNIAENEAKVARETLKLNTGRIAGAINGKSYSQLMDLFKFDMNRQRAIMLALEPYLSEEYQYVQLGFLEDEYNIITLRNSATGAYTFIVVSDLAALDHLRKDAGNILAPVFKDQNELKRFKEARNLPVPSAENLLTLQAMFAINECRDLLSDDQILIDRILVVSASTGVHTLGSNIDRFTDALKLLEYEVSTNKDVLKDPDAYSGINTSWNKNISLSDQKEVLCRVALNRIATFKLTNPDAELDGLGSKNVEDIQQNIDSLISSIEHDYPHDYNNLDTQIGRVYASLKQIKLTFQSGEIYDKLYKHTRWGLTAAETLGAGIDILRYAESKRFSFNGAILNGIAQGLDMSPSYSSPDKAIAFYEQMFRLAARQVTVELVDLAVPFNIATKKFLRAAGKSGFQIAVTGTTASAYEALFEQDGDKIAGNMQLKNPYSSFSELVDFQREYVEEVLWVINRLRLKDSHLDPKYKKMTYEDFKKSDQFKNYVELINNNPEYLEMPLKLKNSAEGVITNIRNLFDADDSELGIRDRLKKFGQSMLDRWEQSIQPVLLTPDQVSGMNQDIDEVRRQFEYHSPYNKQGENRIQMLNNTPINEWEKNLNILALEYACAQFKELYFQLVLHTVGNLLGEIDLMEVMTGKDLSKTKEALINRVKISIYNRNIVEDELKTASSIVAALKQVTSFTRLALRPATFVKEMILGVIRNSSTVILNNFINDVPITFEHLRKAANIVYTNGLFVDSGFAPDDETFGDFRLVGALNNLYRINDRDLNLLGESIAYDNHGIMHWGSRMLYLNTTAPDWFNRMTLLVAKMMADGTWEAHSLSADGHVVYDPTKDKRFARFLSFYKNHPDLKGEPTDEEYVLAKAKYTLTIEQLKKEGYTELIASDAEGYSIIPICYTELEMSSVKEQIGMLYGYYSHEERTIMQKSIAWLLHTQFLTFLPAEIKKYFARGDIESSVGRVVHMTEPFTGKKLYYITNDAGLTEVVNEDELTYDQKTRPVIEFVKTPIEGLLVSTAKTFSQVWHGERNNIPKEQMDRTKLFFFNLLIWALLKALLVGLGVLAVQKGKAAKEEKKHIDSIAATSRVINSVSQELNILGELESAISSMGITGYDQIKSLMGSTMSKMVNNPGDWFSVINQMGAVKDFQIV